MSIDRFLRRNVIGCIFAGIHTLLVLAYAWIELNHAWNDMNPTMLVMAALHLADYPIHVLLAPIIDNTNQLGTYLAVLAVVGGGFWFAIGTFVGQLFRMLCRLTFRQSATSSIT